jgi:hypothetical protein
VREYATEAILARHLFLGRGYPEQIIAARLVK